MAARDPRIDPMAGDEVAAWTLSHPARHHVTKVENGTVFYEIRHAGMLSDGAATLDEWRAWAANTEIPTSKDTGHLWATTSRVV